MLSEFVNKNKIEQNWVTLKESFKGEIGSNAGMNVILYLLMLQFL